MKLMDPNTRTTFSANAGDYWSLNPEHIFKTNEGDNLWLVDDSGNVVKKTVRKKDLKDEIMEGIKKTTSIYNQRKTVGRGKLFNLSTTSGDYIIDSKGRIVQESGFQRHGRKAFTNKWLFNGIANAWGKRVLTWREVLMNPKKLDKIRGKKYVIDIDYGTPRIWGGKINYLYLI